MSPTDKRIAKALAGTPKIVIATVALMEQLASVLTKEIDVVSNRKLDEHADLLKQKQRLAIDYRANMKSLAAQPQILKSLSTEAKEALREMANRLTTATDANANVLRAAVDATRQLIQNVMAMVRNEATPKQAYKNHKKAHLQLGNHTPSCRPVAVSRTV